MFFALTIGALSMLSQGALAQDEPAEPAVDPEAIAALDAMAAHLHTLQTFRLIVTTTIDDVVEGGQLVETGGRSVFDVRRPDRMKVIVANDKSERVFYFDGTTVTQFAPALGFYSTFEAGPTIADMLDMAEEKYGVEVPLADLFYWGTERSNVDTITAAFAVGDGRIGGETCNQYAFRSDVTDFQVWIRKHGDPLPCRLVIVTTDDEARPRYTATIEWNLEPLIGDATFAFTPPPGAEWVEQEQIQANAN